MAGPPLLLRRQTAVPRPRRDKRRVSPPEDHDGAPRLQVLNDFWWSNTGDRSDLR